MASGKASDMQLRQVRVWDLGVRGFHWGLVICVAIGAVTGFLAGRDWLGIHVIAGSTIAALLIFRLIWGWLGSRYALFQSFPLSLRAVRHHLSPAGRGEHHLGHNPLGAVMVYALIGVLALILLTGAVALGGVVKQGPLAFLMSFATGIQARSLHNALAIGLLVMIAAHLGGVVLESWRGRQNLARAMVTGLKESAEAPQSAPVAGHPWIAGLAVAVAAAVLVPGTLALNALPGRGVPPPALDAAYVRECGGCHFAYPPSLAPAQTWVAVMDGLDDHFGENATIDSATATVLRGWLADNSSEHWDTRPAVTLRTTDPAQPQRITAAPAWTRFHRRIAEAVFKSQAVGAKGSCGACHHDASTGRFDPQQIAIPAKAFQ